MINIEEKYYCLQYWKLVNSVQAINNTWNHITVCKQMNSNSFKSKGTYKLFP